MVDLSLKHIDEARFAQLRVIFRAQDQSAVGLAHGTYRGRHAGRFARCGALETMEGRREVWRGESRNSCA